MESDIFYGDFMVKLVWRFSGVFIEELWYIKLPHKLHITFIIKSPTKVSLSILST